MKKTTRVLVALVVLVVVILGGFWLKHQLAIDGCLDAGGRWNYSLLKCER
jgi:hypothetical protein